MQSFRDLQVWQKSMALVTSIYQATRDFPGNESFGLTAQIRRSSVSIPSNIAEGFGRQASGDYLRFLTIARGSLFELQTQLEISMNLGYLTNEAYQELENRSQEIARMLSSFIAKLRTSG